MNVRTLPDADGDVTEAGDYLNLVRPGFGARFATEFDRAVNSIAANPRMYPRTEDGPEEPENREYFIARFRYRVIYALWKEEAVIVAVLHARRQPGTWHARLNTLFSEE